jgi:hypothetical protein
VWCAFIESTHMTKCDGKFYNDHADDFFLFITNMCMNNTLCPAKTANALMQVLCMWAVFTVAILQWGYSYCCPKKQQSCCPSPYLAPDFIIHTIWTINSKREFETNCNGPLFNEKEVHFANDFPLPSQSGLEAGSIINSLACLLLGQ